VSHPDPEQLALAALPAEPPEPHVAAHLDVCPPCRAQVTALRRTADLAHAAAADADVEADGPPPRVWQAIVDELGDELGEELPPVRPAVPRPRWRAIAVPVAAAVAGIAVGLGIGSALAPQAPQPQTTALLAPLTTSPAASGRAGIVTSELGRTLVVEVVDPDGAAGGYLEAWLMDANGTQLYSLGALTAQDPQGSRFRASFALPPELPLDAYAYLDVSREEFDGNPTHSGASLLRGRVI
jgi:hypothetical protein